MKQPKTPEIKFYPGSKKPLSGAYISWCDHRGHWQGGYYQDGGVQVGTLSMAWSREVIKIWCYASKLTKYAKGAMKNAS